MEKQKQTPLIDLLENVPRDAVLVVEHDQFSSSFRPVGRLCHEAAAALRAVLAEVERLRADLMESDEIRDKLGHILTRTAAALKGEPPDGVWHSWHDLPENATQLVGALRKLEEREQRDEALLRQALERLEAVVEHFDPYIGDNECRPMENARYTIAALRERLGGEKA